MKNKYLIVVVIVLVVVNLINLEKIYNNKADSNFLLKTFQNKLKSDSITMTGLMNNQMFLSQNTYFNICPNFKLLTETGKEVLLSDLCGGNNKLIFRYNEFTCQTCIYREMLNLMTLSEKIGKSNIIVLASYKNKRDFIINKMANKIDLPIYNVPLKSFDNTIENFNIPYLFIIDKQFTAKNIFLPDNDLQNLTDLYLLVGISGLTAGLFLCI